jgi:hypothetical protein
MAPSTACVRCVRPSLLDVRFTGDPWIVPDEDGSAALCLDGYRLVELRVLALDLPSLNLALNRMRHYLLMRRARLAS